MAPPLWYAQKYNFEWELGGHCIHDRFYMHQMSLAYMAIFRQASPRPSSPELNAIYRSTAAPSIKPEIILLFTSTFIVFTFTENR